MSDEISNNTDKMDSLDDEISGGLFKRKVSEYKMGINPIAEYMKEASLYISKMDGISLEEAKAKVRAALKSCKLDDPIVTFRSQKPNGDHEKDSVSLSRYLRDVITNHQILAPSFTTYKHPDDEASLHAEFLAINLKKRKADKKKAFEYKQEGNMFLSNYYNTLQKTRKVANNALSGAYASKSTILYNPSAHYTLTSITRSVSSIGNALTESFVAGNKLFYSPDIVMNYISAVISNVDLNMVRHCILKYNLAIPSVDEVMGMIEYSSRRYWRSDEYLAKIREYLSRLSNEELTSVMYVNDFYHLRKCNELFVRDMLDKLRTPVSSGSVDNLKDLTEAEEGIAILAHFIWAKELRGVKIDYPSMVGSELLMKLASTARHISIVFKEYKLLIRTFYTTDILPINIANIVDMLRDVIVLSDTDSTCGSYDEWVRWFYGKNRVDYEGAALAAIVMTMNTQLMDHFIKVFARNMNIRDQDMDILAMKNEFYWPVFIPTNKGKHYFADVMVQEGNVFKQDDLEVKGVQLISSNIDQNIANKAKDMMLDIFKLYKEGKDISLFKYLTEVAKIERSVIDRIKEGDISIYKLDAVKKPNAYALGEDAPAYFNHLLWKEVFEEKYGYPGEPIYNTIKVPTILNSKKDTNDWIESIVDNDIRERISKFLEDKGKDSLSTFRIPLSIVKARGIPEELTPIIDYERVVKDNCNIFYVMLEGIGVYRKTSMLICQMGY